MPEVTLKPDVIRLKDINRAPLFVLLNSHGLSVVEVDDASPIPGSHWGDDEAGLILNSLYCRTDTPIHSILHEACHWILMDEERRAVLHTNAGGTSVEENAVCYLQLLMADRIPEMRDQRMFKDMDAWGYSFRLGSTRAWFEKDAQDAIEFLQARGLFQLYQ